MNEEPMPSAPDNNAFRVSDLWEGSITNGSGFVAIPMALLRLQSKLGLNPTEFGVLVNLAAHRWKPDDLVYPRNSTIAQRMGITPRSVQRATSKLARSGLIEKKRLPNGLRGYDLKPIEKRLKVLFPAALQIQENEVIGA